MRNTYKPSWKDGLETKAEEALWPYVTCSIAGRDLKTQDIGTVKAMARKLNEEAEQNGR